MGCTGLSWAQLDLTVPYWVDKNGLVVCVDFTVPYWVDKNGLVVCVVQVVQEIQVDQVIQVV